MPLLPDAAIDDGVLDVVLLHPKRFLSWLPLAFRVLTKGSKTDELIERFTGRKVVIRAASDTPRQLDGDSIGSGRALSRECNHGRLRVRARSEEGRVGEGCVGRCRFRWWRYHEKKKK